MDYEVDDEDIESIIKLDDLNLNDNDFLDISSINKEIKQLLSRLTDKNKDLNPNENKENDNHILQKSIRFKKNFNNKSNRRGLFGFLNPFFDLFKRDNKQNKYDLVWTSKESKQPVTEGTIEINGQKYFLKDNKLYKEDLKNKGFEDKSLKKIKLLPLNLFKPRISITITDKEAYVVLNTRLLEVYLKNLNLNLKDFLITTRYLEDENGKSSLILFINKENLTLRGQVNLEEATQKEFFKKNATIKEIDLNLGYATLKYDSKN